MTVNLIFHPAKINEKLCLFWHIPLQEYAFICILKRKITFWKFIFDKLWGHDIITSLYWMFIRTGQEIFPKYGKLQNFITSIFPIWFSWYLCTILQGISVSLFFPLNYVNFAQLLKFLDFPFNTSTIMT